MEQLPKKSLRIIRLTKPEILEILSDYFLGDNLEGYSDWCANILEGEDGLEFVAVYGSEGDDAFDNAKNLILNKSGDAHSM